jgi:autotransporter-associated beta strand protein
VNTIALQAGATSATYSGNITVLTSTNSGTSLFAFDAGSNGTLTASGMISGNGTSGVSKTGLGAVLLTGDNSYTGNTTVSGGTLRITHHNALGSTSAGTTVASGSVLELDGSGGALTVDEAITINGSGISGNGPLTSMAGNNTVTRTVTIGSTFSYITASGGSSLTLDVASGNAIEGTNVDLIIDPNGGNITIEDAIALGVGGIQKRWAGTLTLNATDSTFGGGVAINNGITNVTKLADLGNASSLGTGTTNAVIGIGNQAATATLNYTGSGDSTNRTIRIGLGAETTGGATIRNNGSGALTFSSATFNVNDPTLTGTGAGQESQKASERGVGFGLGCFYVYR